MIEYICVLVSLGSCLHTFTILPAPPPPQWDPIRPHPQAPLASPQMAPYSPPSSVGTIATTWENVSITKWLPVQIIGNLLFMIGTTVGSY